MNYTYKQIWLINFPVMMSILMEQLINITDAIFLGHVGEVELGASALASVYYLAIYMLGFGFSLGLQVMIARRNGGTKIRRNREDFLPGIIVPEWTGYVFKSCVLYTVTCYPEVFHPFTGDL